MPDALNYAVEYSQALDQAFPYVLNFGKLYATPNNGRYRWTNANTIQIPSISTTGRVDADRDTIETAKRNYSNVWVPKTLENFRKWSTLVHPLDVDETKMVTSIQNITQVYNQEQKFPEMDAYTASKLFAEFTALEGVPQAGTPTTATILGLFDEIMTKMTEKRVPKQGRILYITPTMHTVLNNAVEISRTLDLAGGSKRINNIVNDVNDVEIIEVPSDLMQTLYDFTVGWKAGVGAKQIHMLLVHPLAVITPVKYTFSKLDPPGAMSEGKYVYYEESYEDVFILPNKKDAAAFVVAE